MWMPRECGYCDGCGRTGTITKSCGLSRGNPSLVSHPTTTMSSMTVSDLGKSLVEARTQLDMQEAAWFADLAEFDRRGEWAVDGHLSCVSWLVQFCGMARPTAKDKLRVALQLTRRPVLARAHAGGELS